ncbi:hypothetical protein ACGFX4_00060 [Kitasatospora sp. NPDC048365]|uniref:hypothetical protein n=1 Tax=Kitasatospora sp. NPDC048365 TaxID=3364050 RepID=UPI0037222B8B
MREILPAAVLGCLAVVGLAGTGYAIARLRRYLGSAEQREARALAELTSAQTSAVLLRLLTDVHAELRRANAERGRPRDAREPLSRRPEPP